MGFSMSDKGELRNCDGCGDDYCASCEDAAFNCDDCGDDFCGDDGPKCERTECSECGGAFCPTCIVKGDADAELCESCKTEKDEEE